LDFSFCIALNYRAKFTDFRIYPNYQGTFRMGFHVLRASAFTSITPTATTTITRNAVFSLPTRPYITSNLKNSSKHSIPTCLNKSKLRSFVKKPQNHPIFSTGFGGISRNQPKISLRFVAMAAGPGSVQKSEEEWRAILSPEQFRILREKGTEYALFYISFYSLVICICC